MTTYSVRCKHKACRHRRVTRTHPDEYKVVPRCLKCGHRKGWRIENRAYNKRGLCNCNGPDMVKGQHFPHRTTHPYCDHHPHGFYNQAREKGVAHEDIPTRYWPMDKKTDNEMASDMRQLWQELVRMQREMERRGYEVQMQMYYGSDKATVNFNRTQENVL